MLMKKHLETDHIIEKKIKIGRVPAILLRPATSDTKIPTIIWYHGWSSNKENQRIRGFIYASLGYQVLIPDAIYHGERSPLSDYGEESLTKFFWDVVLKNLEESTDLINSLVNDYEADPEKIGVTGHSMGGFTAAGVFTRQPGLKALVVLNGSCAWEDSNERFKKTLNLGDIDKRLEAKVKDMDPMNNLDLLKNRPILLLHGDKDGMVPIESQEIFYEKLNRLNTCKEKLSFVKSPGLDHFVTTGMMEKSIKWFHNYVKK